MRKDLTIVIADLQESDLEALAELGGEFVAKDGRHTWVNFEFESGFFSLDEDDARKLQNLIAPVVPHASVVAYDFQEQYGRMRGYLEGDRWGNPVDSGGAFGVSFSQADVRFGEKLDQLEHTIHRRRYLEGKERKRQGQPKPELTSLRDVPKTPLAAVEKPSLDHSL
jgi:hypothetical protein